MRNTSNRSTKLHGSHQDEGEEKGRGALMAYKDRNEDQDRGQGFCGGQHPSQLKRQNQGQLMAHRKSLTRGTVQLDAP